MSLTIATWNINSVRIREGLVRRLLVEEAVDVLCLQETKAPVDKLPLQGFREMGYRHVIARGEKGYNGVMILSRVPIEEVGHRSFCGKEDTRHIAARLEDGTVIHNLYVPAGGYEPDPVLNPKFRHKLDFIEEMRAWFAQEQPERAILVGDLNVAPREDDVWNHRQLLKVVSHTPMETEAFGAMQEAGKWVDIVRKDIPTGRLYSWWSYRSPNWDAADKGRRLDHFWASSDIAARVSGSRIPRHVRGWDTPSDHVPVIAQLA